MPTQNRIRSLLIMPAFMMSAGLFFWGFFVLLSRPGWGPAATTVATAPMVLVMIRIMLTKTARTSRNFPLGFGMVAVGLLLGVIALVNGEGVVGLLLGSYGVVVFSGYVFWYSVFGDRTNTLLGVGSPLPDFSVVDLEGEVVHSTEFKSRPTVLLFFRGNWCPLCMAQIGEIAALYREIAAKGAGVVLISPQSQSHTQKLAQKFDVPFRFLRDPGNEAAKLLQIEHKFGLPAGMGVLGYDSDTVLPTVLITDADGTILFADLTDNYRVRPEPSLFLGVLEGRSVVDEASGGEQKTAASEFLFVPK